MHDEFHELGNEKFKLIYFLVHISANILLREIKIYAEYILQMSNKPFPPKTKIYLCEEHFQLLKLILCTIGKGNSKLLE